MDRLHRRNFLQTAAGVSTIGVAGCSLFTSEQANENQESPPELTENGGDPAQISREYLQAVENNNSDKAASLTHSASSLTFNPGENFFITIDQVRTPRPDEETVETEEEFESTRTVVTGELTTSESSVRIEYHFLFRRENGKWKVWNVIGRS